MRFQEEKGKQMKLRFQVADVKKPLAAVKRICENGNLVSFGPKEEDKFIPWHWLHYGFPDRKKKGWWFRDTKFWNSNNMVFRKIQKLCREHNYFLYDISDPQKGNKTLMKLSVNRVDEYEEEVLWHNFNNQIMDE